MNTPGKVLKTAAEASDEQRQRERLINLALAAGLFIASTLMVEIIRMVSGLEFGGRDPAPGSLSGLCRWDCAWYGTIVEGGYHLKPLYHPQQDAANWAFFPGFPLTAKLIQSVTHVRPAEALVMTSRLFLFASIAAFIEYSQTILGRKGGWLAGAILAFSPYAIYAHAGYTESMYFLLTTLAFWQLGRHAWIWSGLAGGMMSATRIVGAAFTLAYLGSTIGKTARHVALGNRINFILGLLLIPSGLAAYMLFLYSHVGDALAFKHVMVAWGRSSSNLLESLQAAWSWGFWGIYFALTALLGLAASAWHLFKQRYDMGLYMAATVLIPLMSSVGSMPRYVFWQMPVLLAIAEITVRRRSALMLYLIFAASTSTVMITAWFKGNVFVV